jgi:predicted amidohydrolase YtcJ
MGKMMRLFVVGATSALLFATPAYADTLIENVNGLTLDKDGKLIRFTGIVIDNDGRVKRLLDKPEPTAATPKKRKKGKDAPPPPQAYDYRYNAQGQVMLPGMIDAHGHVMGLGFQIMLLDLSSAKSLNEAKAMIRDYAAKNPAMPWIIGRGWNQEIWGLGRFPNAADLDDILPDRPVWLERVDGHAGWANSKAMAMAGVTAASKSPPGGRIDMIGGKPSGIFVDAASVLITNSLPKPLPRDLDDALTLAQTNLLSMGITSIADMGTTLPEWQAFRRAGDEGRLKIRILSYAGDVDNMTAIAGSRPTPWLYQDRLRMVGVKLYMDGALGSRGAWLKRHYEDAAGESGLPLLSESAIRNKMVNAASSGFQIAVHAIGDKANAEVLNAIDDVAPSFGGDRRWRIEHAQVVDPADLERFGKNGIIASMQPVHQTSDRLMAEARLGKGRLKGAYAWASMLKAGSRLAFGSDVPVESANPFAGLAVAISREDANGEPMGGWMVDERVSREQALDGFTRSAAFASFAEDRLGTLMPGMRADFILIDQDPMLASPRVLRGAIVNETWVGGKPAWLRKKDSATLK